MSFLRQRLDLFAELINKTSFEVEGVEKAFDEAQKEFYSCFKRILSENKKVFVIGNGGSSGIASHHVVDLVNVLKAPAFTLSDSNLLTCMGNDYGYNSTFSRPLDCLANAGDLLIAISSSGQSENILNACNVMREKDGKVITLSGFDSENPLRSLGNINIWTGECDYGLVESAHFFILHTFIDGWKQHLSSPKSEDVLINQL